MAIETFKLKKGIVTPALAFGNVGAQLWPKVPPPADPVTGGALRLWRFKNGAYSLTEIYQPAHAQLTLAQNAPAYGPKSAVLSNVTGLNGLVAPSETAAQTNIMVVRNYDPAGNSMLMNSTTATSTDGGFQIFRQAGFAGIRVQSRGITTASGSTATDTIDTSALSQSLFLVVGVAHTATSRLFYIHGFASVSRTSVAYVKETTARGVGVGNTFANNWSRSPEFSAFAQYDAAMTAQQFSDFAAWLALLERRRGVPVYG